MKNMIRLAGAAAVLAFAAAAQAQVYVEGAYNFIDIKGSGSTAKPTAVSAVLGYEINPNVAAEVYVASGVKKATDGTKLSNSFGVFLKPKVMVSNEVEVFARVGFEKTKLSSGSDNASDNSFAYGVGGNYFMDKKTYVTASYMSHYNKDGLKINGLNIGVGYKF
ncbi:porin family protein [Limnohabitans planktonicus]|uniref:Outer membrane protein beta-barrel domain-containing protein n=1 Tax=Limnohabitans planktonicus II-D5 TaxID=1293045 RepID=A0A2T7U8H0_9BURK|nr:porin family protein [Limnohabitans planktonicus]PVE40975.1 hypothetical protein H663_019685 [Limnohabitans planktonicus II-D5]